MKNLRKRVPRCWICKDEGLVYYYKKENGFEYEMVASCKCKEGLEYSNAALEVSSSLAEWVAETNLKNWKENNPELAERLMDIEKVE